MKTSKRLTSHQKPSPIPAVVERVGVAVNRSLRFAVLFQRLKVKLSTKYRVWPVPGDDHYLELDPSEWRDRYRVVCEHCTDAALRPS